jgi:hypothetical protein
LEMLRAVLVKPLCNLGSEVCLARLIGFSTRVVRFPVRKSPIKKPG